MKFKSIKELHEAVKSGVIDESKLVIELDNDDTFYSVGGEQITVDEANGCYDVGPLYNILFPKSQVGGC